VTTRDQADAPAGTGLSTAEAAARRRRDGPNSLPVAPPPAAWRLLLAQMGHFFALMLWVAGGLAFVAGMPQLGVAIFVIVVVNGLFAFVQEHRAERAAERLRDLLPLRATVVRDGAQRTLDASELVVGDLVLLSAGDRLSADLRLVEAHRLQIDTSTLTGESVPLAVEERAPLFAGCFVVAGEGAAEVVAVGAATRLAAVAGLTRAGRRPRSPLARELDRVVRTIGAIALGVGVLFFGVAVVLGLPPGAGFLFAIGVCVALVPEGLLPTVTLSLALGAQRMAARQALVRRLESVETLGSTTFVCTDKTGTLTRNEMAVVSAWTPAGWARISGVGYEPAGAVEAAPAVLPALHVLALAAARCARGRAVEREGRWCAEGDPMEAAFDVLARRLGLDVAADERADPSVRRIPFDAHRRRTALVTGGQLLVSGAPEAVLPRCRDGQRAVAAVERMAAQGLRVLAVAARPVDPTLVAEAGEELETGLALLGLVGLEDPPRPEAAAAIAACRRAGIRVAMVTGDHPGTAAAIAREVGLAGPGATVIDGRDLPPDEDRLGELLDRDGVVVSRVAPEGKLRIARALRRRGHVVAMTGDGVNDGPALQAADIGIAMGRSGTDVAREAADLVLLDDNFATIVEAVAHGRATFANVRRCLTYHLTDNVAELAPFVVWALSAGQFPLALGVLQILCLDLVTDQLPALALGVEPASRRLPQRTVRGVHLLDGALLRRVFGVLGPAEAAVELGAFAAVLLAAGWWPGAVPPPGALLAASGAAFAAVVVGQAANAFACRSDAVWPGVLGWGTNRFLLWSAATGLLLLAALLYVAPVAALLGQAPPTALGWGVALLAAPAVLLADALNKRSRARRADGAAAAAPPYPTG
jgi:magnesium-transporting ATPase (P-type)